MMNIDKAFVYILRTCACEIFRLLSNRKRTCDRNTIQNVAEYSDLLDHNFVHIIIIATTTTTCLRV